MIPAIVEVRPLEDFCLWLRFRDGACGTLDLRAELWGPVFEPLRDPALFRQARLDPELETVTWPNGADFAPEFLYDRLQRVDATAEASHSAAR